MSIDVGARLKEVRLQKSLSQRELAKRAGVTNSTISLIEQNRVSPSVSSLKKVLDGIPMQLQEFFSLNVPEKKQVFYPADELPDLGHGEISLHLVGHNYPNRTLSLLRETYPPGSDTGSEMLTHEGQEAGVVIRGSIELTVDGESRLLGPGDAYFFDSSLAHRFKNSGDETCEIVSANNPPSI
ncbi:cupin domain-containing protein [Motiliproteus sp. SC1-56]|uniref:cupin domain-containing protein n=1 Tax=Motiliproteus sp. SC1-56 TaxID=2799565 RepID=UPI001A8D62F0|nr:cupin domain-containing protein [Motiliproteus sp. SC1-56]